VYIIASIYVNYSVHKRKDHNDRKVHYEHNCIYIFLNYKSTDMNITKYVVTMFKCEVIIDIQCSLKNSIISGFNY
jgi:hypothetical protein